MRILVTGAGGLLGVALQKAATEMADEYIFTGYDDFDITDAQAVDLMIKVNGFDVVVNSAAVTDVEKAENYPDVAYNVNVKGVENLARAIAQEGGILIQPGCNVKYLSEKSVISETKRRGIEALTHSGCNAVIIAPAIKNVVEWSKEVGRVALLIIEIVNEIRNNKRCHGVEIVEFNPQGSDE